MVAGCPWWSCHCVSMLSRRDVLVAALAGSGAALLTACGSTPDDAPATDAQPGGDDALRRDVAQAEQSLIHRYEAALESAPAALASLLTRIRDEHLDHLSAMGVAPASAPASANPGRVDALRAAERDAARGRRTAAVAARDAELTRVLALIAASEAGHVVALREAGA